MFKLQLKNEFNAKVEIPCVDNANAYILFVSDINNFGSSAIFSILGSGLCMNRMVASTGDQREHITIILENGITYLKWMNIPVSNDFDYYTFQISIISSNFLKITNEQNERITKLEKIIEEMYYSPGMPGYIQSKESFLENAKNVENDK